MYKIMLADDEGIVIEALTYIIENNFKDECVIESAKTGRKVIELAEHFRPDIAFMDIMMPGINGIEAMKEIRNSGVNPVFIVLSAYDRFDYAKQALGVGVIDYINKPIEKNKIISVLQKAMKAVDDLRGKRSNELMMREKLENIQPIIESGLIYSILFQDNFKEETERYKQLLGIDADSGYVMVLSCGESQENGHLTNTIGAGIRIQEKYNEIREIIREYFPGIIGPMMANSIVIYVPVANKADDEYENRIEIIENARKIIRNLSGRIDVTFRIGIGSVMPLEKAGLSYTEAINAGRLTNRSVGHAKDLSLACDYEEDYPVETEKKLFVAIKSGNIENATNEAGKFFDWMIDTNSDNIMDIKLKSLEFVLWAEKIGYESGGMTYRFDSRHGYLDTIIRMNNYEELRTWFLTKIQNVCRNVVQKKEENAADIISQAREYIDSYYGKEITLNDISRRFNISPYYFSKLFAQEAGKSFIEYLTDTRIEKAKELLQFSDKNMKEICMEIGYADPNYFSRLFKKNVGMTPTEFKEKI